MPLITLDNGSGLWLSGDLKIVLKQTLQETAQIALGFPGMSESQVRELVIAASDGTDVDSEVVELNGFVPSESEVITECETVALGLRIYGRLVTMRSTVPAAWMYLSSGVRLELRETRVVPTKMAAFKMRIALSERMKSIEQLLEEWDHLQSLRK